jgi:hypothetical protein
MPPAAAKGLQCCSDAEGSAASAVCAASPHPRPALTRSCAAVGDCQLPLLPALS